MITLKLQPTPAPATLSSTLPGSKGMSTIAEVNADARRWAALAVGSLVIAGLLSLSVVVGRLPVLSRLIDDPLFFKRCLVAHVDLSLLVWFYAFIAALLSLSSKRGYGRIGHWTFVLSAAGAFVMLGGALARGARPIMSNYIPVIDHPVFLGGLGMFFAGVIGLFVTALASKPTERSSAVPEVTRIGLKASALCVVLALVTWSSAPAGLPPAMDRASFFEFSFWGAGHALQVANASAMLAVWLWIVERLTGKPCLSRRGAALIFGVLIAPHFGLPLLTLRGTLDGLYHTGATQLMRWGIFPAIGAVIFVGIRHFLVCGIDRDSRRGRALTCGLAASVGLTLL